MAETEDKSFFEEKKQHFLMKGQLGKVKYLETLHMKLLPQQVERIQQNDKTVLRELVLPSWLSWDLLFDWANQMKLTSSSKRCVFCNETDEVFINFKEKFICNNCFVKLKNL